MKQQKYFNNNKPAKPQVRNRRDADMLVKSTHKAAAILFLTVLHDKFGFGKKRCDEVMEHVHDLLDSYNKGYVSVQDLNEVLHEEVGIKIL